MKRTTARIVGPAGAIAAAGLFWLLSHGGASSSAAVRGYVEAIDQPLASLQAGRVAELRVHVGQAVAAGEIVARIDGRSLELARSTAATLLAQARAELVAEEITIADSLARAELLVLKTVSQQSSERAQLATVREQLARLEKLAGDQLVQARDVEQSKLREAGLSASLSVLDAGKEQRQAGLGRQLRQVATKEQLARRLEPYREAVRGKELALQAAELALQDATVRAPVAGTIALVLHQPGDVVTAGAELVRLASGRPGMVICWLPERVATRVVAGGAVRLQSEGLWSPSFAGRVAELSPELEDLPVRARVSPNVPGWGRRVIVESTPPRPLVLGEALHVRF
jgi:HlyD family secretion protein